MKTLVIFQLDLIRRANYPAFHEHLNALFADNAEQFIKDTLPIVNKFKQAQITQTLLFAKLQEKAQSLGVEMDEVAVRGMWAKLHPDPKPLVQDIRAAIEYVQTGHGKGSARGQVSSLGNWLNLQQRSLSRSTSRSR